METLDAGSQALNFLDGYQGGWKFRGRRDT